MVCIFVIRPRKQLATFILDIYSIKLHPVLSDLVSDYRLSVMTSDTSVEDY